MSFIGDYFYCHVKVNLRVSHRRNFVKKIIKMIGMIPDLLVK